MKHKSFFFPTDKKNVVILLYFATMRIFQINSRALSNDV